MEAATKGEALVRPTLSHSLKTHVVKKKLLIYTIKRNSDKNSYWIIVCFKIYINLREKRKGIESVGDHSNGSVTP